MLDGLFNFDNPFFRFVNRIADMFLLNILFLVSCIPIVTIGSALTAMYYVSINTLGREDGYIFQMYVRSFRQNFKQSTVMWLLFLFAGALLSVDTWFWINQWKQNQAGIYKGLIVVQVALIVLYVMAFTFAWPLMAKFTNTIKGTIKNAFIMVLTHVPQTLLIWAVFAAVAVIAYVSFMMRILLAFIGFSLVAYLQAMVFRQIFKPFLGEEKHATPEEEAETLEQNE